MNILYGKPVAEQIRQRILSYTNNNTVTIATIGLDGDEQWNQYTSSLLKSASNYNCTVVNYTLPVDVDFDTFAGKISELNNDGNVDGVLIQQPLPKHLSGVVDLLDPHKDIDGLTASSVKAMFVGKECFLPATALAVVRLLEFYNIDTAVNVTIVGRGLAVGKPLALMLTNRNATVTLCHTKTKNVTWHCKNSDIVVSACGVANLIGQQHVDENTVAIDVGLSFVNGKTCGDINAEEIQDKCRAYSPVPGGVGPVTRACLFENAVKAHSLKVK